MVSSASKDKMVCEMVNTQETWFSFEYFPPKTEDGVKNLKKRILRMKELNPVFTDFTWGAGGSTSELTMQLCDWAKNEGGCVANMHLTCTNMEPEKIDKALADCKKCGVCNLVALRGDPPRGQDKWEAVEGGFTCALDLCKYITKNHGDYFSIAVAGYPEGHLDSIKVVEGGLSDLTESEKWRSMVWKDEKTGEDQVTVCRDADYKKEMEYLKSKIDAGGKLVITQMFLDPQVFINFVKECRAYGINVPIVPGIICLNSYAGFQRMVAMSKTRLPDGMEEAAKAANTSDEAFKKWGIEFMADVCDKVLKSGAASGLHFYTLNQEKATLGMLKQLKLITDAQYEKCLVGDADAKSMVSAQGITTFSEETKVAKPTDKKERTFLFSSESVNEGHPDKLCDQVSDAVLDACLTVDPKSKVACETATKDNMVMVAGEITTQAKLDYDAIVRSVVLGIGFDSFVDDLSSVDSKGLSDKTCEVIVRINKQSPDIAGGVHVGKDDLDVGAGDQGIMFGYASDETEDCMPLTHSMATRLGKKLTDVRKNGKLWWLRPDGKTQVTIEYLQKADGSVEPKKIHTVVISTQHAEPSKAVRSKECAGYTGPEMTAPSMEEMNQLIVDEVVKETLKEITLKSGESALTLFGDHTHLHINPSGKFIIGGPQGDAGLTGRKIIIDTYGGWGAHGGGAFSGKDPTKVDRSAAYICRQMAKSVVKSGLCKRALVQLSYAIGVAKPLSLFVETYGTEQGSLTADDITKIVKIEFDCRPGAIAQSLALREPKYQETAAYCHFGRQAVTKDGIKFFEWENAKDVSKYKPMNSEQVNSELLSSNYLTKWVD